MIKFNYENSSIKESTIIKYSNDVTRIHNEMNEKAGDEKEFLGWINLPTNYDKKEFERIKKAGKKIRKGFRCISCNRNRRLLFRS